mmetsp:Transcript_992/g.3425  ORF Transcript_992/g.3425 Transcript_992/m.3425 type:complete len:118 (-) Transcript_992:1250-1603(-)
MNGFGNTQWSNAVNACLVGNTTGSILIIEHGVSVSTDASRNVHKNLRAPLYVHCRVGELHNNGKDESMVSNTSKGWTAFLDSFETAGNTTHSTDVCATETDAASACGKNFHSHLSSA